MDKTTHEVRLEHWKEIVRRCQARPEGQTAAAWLEENGIHNKQYYYWLRQIRREAYEEIKSESLPAAPVASGITFAEVPFPDNCSRHNGVQAFSPDAVIQAGHITVAVSNSISSALLGRIMEAVNHAR